MNIRTRVIATVSLLIAFAMVLQAQSKAKTLNPPELKVFRVVVQNGKETFVPGDKVQPGDVLEYRLVVKNNLSVPASLEPIMPVPRNLVFEPNANLKAPTAASTDGVNYGTLPLKRKRAGAEETVPLSEYRFLRWTVPSLAPGASVEVKARMRLPK